MVENEEFEVVDPSPASIVESLRAIGYSLETAIADLIDNSITAGASLVCIDSPITEQRQNYFYLITVRGWMRRLSKMQ